MCVCIIHYYILAPVSGGRTPSYGTHGFMTPSQDPSRTPLHTGGGAWDPSVTNTPARCVCVCVCGQYPMSHFPRPDDWSYYTDSAPSPQSYANPATPGLSTSYDNPNTPSPFVPDSPQSGASHYSSQFNARSSLYTADYKFTPSPGFSPTTPGSNIDYTSPRTPGSPMEAG